MEKRKPTYDLESFKAVFSKVEDVYTTINALKDARSLGFTIHDIVEAIQMMRHAHFYKSMTSYADHSAWQDVYHVPFRDLILYIKFTADRITEFRLLSFKKK